MFNWTSTKIRSCRWTKSWFQNPTTQQLNFYSFSFCNFSICKYDCFVFDLPFEIIFKTKFNSIIISNSSNYIMRLRMSVECCFCYYKPLVLQTQIICDKFLLTKSSYFANKWEFWAGERSKVYIKNKIRFIHWNGSVHEYGYFSQQHTNEFGMESTLKSNKIPRGCYYLQKWEIHRSIQY